ncbi:DUF503 domain-containing protein [Vulgatibacter incomptus]|nr:DUF503 domain-containing protein [Vulgatibacter incomptus]
MVIGTLRFVLQIPGVASLKGKRHILRKVIDRVRARFNVSVAEVGDNDLWQRATIGVAAVGNEPAFVNEVLDKVLRSVDESGVEAWVVTHQLEITTVGDVYGGIPGVGPERTLAEAEGLVDHEDEDEDALFEGEELPTLEELEAAAEIELSTPRGPPRRRG